MSKVYQHVDEQYDDDDCALPIVVCDDDDDRIDEPLPGRSLSNDGCREVVPPSLLLLSTSLDFWLRSPFDSPAKFTKSHSLSRQISLCRVSLPRHRFSRHIFATSS